MLCNSLKLLENNKKKEKLQTVDSNYQFELSARCLICIPPSYNVHSLQPLQSLFFFLGREKQVILDLFHHGILTHIWGASTLFFSISAWVYSSERKIWEIVYILFKFLY